MTQDSRTPVDAHLTGLNALLAARGATAAEIQEIAAHIRAQLIRGELPATAERVRVAAVRALLERRGAGPDEGWLARLVAPQLEPPALADTERTDIRDAIGEAIGRVPARDRALLRMHLEHGLGADPIAKLLRIDRVAAERMLLQLERELVAHARGVLAKRWGDNATLARIATTLEQAVRTIGEP